MSTLEIGFERFEENELDNRTIPEEQEEQQQEYSCYYKCLDERQHLTSVE